MAGLAVAYLFAGLDHARTVNTDARSFDQGAYLNYAKKMQASGYTFAGDRNRMPGYPFLLSLLHEPDLGDEGQFERAKRFNLLLSLALLAGIGFILVRSLPVFDAANLLLITGFLVFLFKAPYVQCELLYYALSFSTFLLMLGLLMEPGLKRAVATGALAGLSYLTKASALPGVLLFLAFAGIWFLLRWLRERRAPGAGRPAITGLMATGLVALAFLAVVFPYVRNSRILYGSYFYNVNSTFYIWYDTRDQIFSGTRMHGDREGWPRMPPEEIPGPGRYFREHSAAQIAGRIAGGYQRLHETARKSYGFYKYLLLYAGVAVVMLVSRPRAWLSLSHRRRGQILFATLYVLAYLTLFAWSSATIWATNRLSLQVFLPAIFCLAWIIARSVLVVPPVRVGARSINTATLFNWAVLCLLAPEIVIVLTSRLMTTAGGH